MSDGLAVHRQQTQQSHQRPGVPDLTSRDEPGNRPQGYPLGPANLAACHRLIDPCRVLADEHHMLGIDQTGQGLKRDQVPDAASPVPSRILQLPGRRLGWQLPSSTGPPGTSHPHRSGTNRCRRTSRTRPGSSTSATNATR